MSISEARQKIKSFVTLIEKREVYGSLLIIFVGLSSFALGRLSTEEYAKTPVTIENIAGLYGQTIPTVGNREVTPSITPKANIAPIKAQTSVTASTGNYVASKSGKRFYLPTCSGVKRINEANKVWFMTKEDAIAAGFTPANNCDGL